MPNFKKVNDPSDSGSIPTIEEMRDSQRAGSTGTGTDESYADKMAARDQGTGKGEGTDEVFPEAGAGNAVMPWE